MPDSFEYPYFGFKEKRLLIYTEEARMKIQGWPPEAEIKEGYYQWSPFKPKFQVVKPYRPVRKKKASRKTDPQLDLGLRVRRQEKKRRRTTAEQKKWAFDQFRFSLPKEVASSIDKFQGYQWNPLRAMYHIPAARDLFISNPILAFYLVNNKRFVLLMAKKAYGIAAEVLAMKQKELLEWMKFGNAQRIAKLLRKVPPQSAAPEGFALLRDLSRDEDGVQALAHVELLNRSIIEIGASNELRALTTPKLLEEISGIKQEMYYPFTARKLQEVYDLMRLAGRREQRALRSIEQVQVLYDELAREFVEMPSGGLIHVKIPRPPFPGTEDIIPITTVGALTKEGKTMHNCVAMYASAVSRGCEYIYRVNAPERATLSIAPAAPGRWIVKELRAACNQDAKPATYKAVREWLGACNTFG